MGLWNKINFDPLPVLAMPDEPSYENVKQLLALLQVHADTEVLARETFGGRVADGELVVRVRITWIDWPPTNNVRFRHYESRVAPQHFRRADL